MRKALVLAACCMPLLSAAASFHPERADVYFSPGGGAVQAIVQAIDSASGTVELEAYHFTSKPVLKALERAKARGAAVRLVLDKENRTAAKSLAGAAAKDGISVRIDSEHRTAHNKVIIVDGRIVVTGSLNFTGRAERENAENTLILESPELARAYGAEFERHWAHSGPWLQRP